MVPIMRFNDLREFLASVDEIGELKRVRGADPLTDIGPITEIVAWSPEHPMVLFEDIPGFPARRLAVHASSSYKRQQLLYGFPAGLRGRELASLAAHVARKRDPGATLEVAD